MNNLHSRCSVATVSLIQIILACLAWGEDQSQQIKVGPVNLRDADAIDIAKALNGKVLTPIHMLISRDVANSHFNLELADEASLKDVLIVMQKKIKNMQCVPAGKGVMLIGGEHIERLNWISSAPAGKAELAGNVNDVVRKLTTPPGWWFSPQEGLDRVNVELVVKDDSRGDYLLGELADQADIRIFMIVDTEPINVEIITHSAFDVDAQRFAKVVSRSSTRREGMVSWTFQRRSEVKKNNEKSSSRAE